MFETTFLFSAGMIGVLFLIFGVFIILKQQISGPNKEFQDEISKLEKEIRSLD